MLPKLEWGDRTACRGPLIVMCHWLGGSAQAWSLVAERLAERGLRCVAVDLPGFGAAAEIVGYTVREMADAVIATVREVRAHEPATPWLLAGHSMGGKVAAVVAREAVNGAEGGAEGLAGLRGLVLVSPSPPGPEPMKESKRAEMLETIAQRTGDSAKDQKHAEAFAKQNAGDPALGKDTLRDAVEGVLRAKPIALRAWLESGSKEDWQEFVGVLPFPARVFAGSEDAALGPDAQRTQTLPHFAAGRRAGGDVDGGELIVLDGAGHLAPLERPGEVADCVTEFCAELGLDVRRRIPLGAAFDALLESDKTSPQTRSVMQGRLGDGNAAYEPQAVGRKGMRVLREFARRVVPQAPFDLPARVDALLADGKGDGWRPADLPADADAWRRGLASLDAGARRSHGVGFVALNDEWQDALLARAAAGDLGPGLGEWLVHAAGISFVHEGSVEPYSGAEMQHWFEDARGTLTKLYMADPRTLERVGFAGFADEQGFTQIRLGEHEAPER